MKDLHSESHIDGEELERVQGYASKEVAGELPSPGYAGCQAVASNAPWAGIQEIQVDSIVCRGQQVNPKVEVG